MAVKKNPTTLELAEPFVSLFPVDATTLKLVTDSMREHGYEVDKPVLAWRDAFGERGRTVVVDGHTRLRAALDLKLREVWVTVRQFRDVDAAITAGIGEQVQRRNLNREQIAAYVVGILPALDPHVRGGLATRTGKQLADLLGVSEPTVKRARALYGSGRDDLIDAVKSGDMSLLAAYTESTGGAPPVSVPTVKPMTPLDDEQTRAVAMLEAATTPEEAWAIYELATERQKEWHAVKARAEQASAAQTPKPERTAEEYIAEAKRLIEETERLEDEQVAAGVQATALIVQEVEEVEQLDPAEAEERLEAIDTVLGQIDRLAARLLNLASELTLFALGETRSPRFVRMQQDLSRAIVTLNEARAKLLELEAR